MRWLWLAICIGLAVALPVVAHAQCVVPNCPTPTYNYGTVGAPAGAAPSVGTWNAVAPQANGVPVGPVVANTTALRGTCTTAAGCPTGDGIAATGVWRQTDGVANAPPLFFTPGTGACSTDDGASCVSAANGANHWNGQFPNQVADARQFSAVPDGTTNDLTALQACLNAMSPGGTCRMDGRFYWSGSLSVPLKTTLQCGDSMPIYFGSQWNTAPVLVYDNTVTSNPIIKASGHGAAVTNCAIIPKGVTYPISTYSGNFGVNVQIFDDEGFNDFHLLNVVFTGGDGGWHVHGNRPRVEHVYGDGLGQIASEGVGRWDVANTDSGNFTDVEFADGWFSNNTFLCLPGTGMYVGGTPLGASGIFMSGKVVSEGYLTSDLNLQNSILATDIWLDYSPTCASGVKSLIIGPGVKVNATRAVINSNGVGITTTSNGTVSNIIDLEIYMGTGGTVAINSGDSSNSGNIVGDTLVVANAPGVLFSALHNNDELYFHKLLFANINGGTYPIFTAGLGVTPSVCPLNCNVWFDVINGGSAGNNLFNNTEYVIGPGGINITRFLAAPAVTSPTGIGASGTVDVRSGGSDASGVVELNTNGSPSASGHFTFTTNMPGSTVVQCSFEYTAQNSSTAWAPSAPIATSYLSGNSLQVTWTNGSALSNSSVYDLSYNCSR